MEGSPYFGDRSSPTHNPYEDQLNHVYELHAKLNDMVGHLDDKVDVLVSQHDKVMIQLYHKQVHAVTREMMMWKEKAEDNVSRMMKDEMVVKMSQALAWFRDECVRLANELNTKTVGYNNMKARVTVLEEENTFLTSQVKQHSRGLTSMMKNRPKGLSNADYYGLLKELRDLFDEFEQKNPELNHHPKDTLDHFTHESQVKDILWKLLAFPRESESVITSTEPKKGFVETLQSFNRTGGTSDRHNLSSRPRSKMYGQLDTEDTCRMPEIPAGSPKLSPGTMKKRTFKFSYNPETSNRIRNLLSYSLDEDTIKSNLNKSTYKPFP